MGHWATNDAFFNIEQVDVLEKKLRQAGVPFEFHRYESQHAFANETMVNPPIPVKFDASAAETAWQRTMAFLKKHIG
jgi:carboxymethylenebutenolidase